MDRMRGRSLGAGAREVDKFVRGWRAMDAMGAIVAIRVNFETHGVIPGRVWQEWNMIPLGLEQE